MRKQQQSPQQSSLNNPMKASDAITPVKKMNNQNHGNAESSRKVSIGSQLRMKEAGPVGANSTNKSNKRYGYESQGTSPMDKISITGASKIISDRSVDTVGNINVIQNRLKLQQNESSQANFDEVFERKPQAQRNDTLPLRMNPMHLSNIEPLYDLDSNQLKQTVGQVMLESRSSVLLGGEFKVNEQRCNEQINGEVDSPQSSRQSLQLNTEINVENISVSPGLRNSSKGLRKAATNAQMVSMGLKKEDETNRQQLSQFIDNTNKQGSPSYNRHLSPVIITSLDQSAFQQKNRKSIIFDVKSSTPNSERQGTPILGTNSKIIALEEIVGQQTEMGRSVTQEDVEEQHQRVMRVSSPVITTLADRITVPVPLIAMTDLHEASDTEGVLSPLGLKGSMEGVTYKGANTLHLVLYDPKCSTASGKAGIAPVGDPGATATLLNAASSAGSPFRQNGTQAHLMSTLDQVAAQSEEDTVRASSTIYLDQGTETAKLINTSTGEVSTSIDDATKRSFRDAMALHQDSSKKKWKNMTPYERSKVMATFLKLQKELEKKGNVEAGKSPKRIQQDLSFCLSVGEIKPGPNPFIKLAEKKLGPLRSKDSANSELNWDDQTLGDPNKIVASVLSAQSREAYEMAQYCPENTPDAVYVTSSHIHSPKTELASGMSTTESQILNELEQFRRQKGMLMRENMKRVVGSEGNGALQLSPSQSILHQRYQLGSGEGSMGSSEQDQLLAPLIEEITMHQSSLNDRTKQMESSTNVSICKRLSPRMGLVKSPFNHYIASGSSSNRHLLQKYEIPPQYKLDTDKKNKIIVKEGGEIEEKELKIVSILSVAPQRNKVALQQATNEVATTNNQAQQTSMKGEPSQLSNLKIISPEMQQLLQMSHQTLSNKIKSTINTRKKEYNSPKHINSLAQLGPRSIAEDLQEMTCLNLQAISLTRKHQMSMTQVPECNTDINSSPKQKQSFKSPQRLNLKVPDSMKLLESTTQSARSFANGEQSHQTYLKILGVQTESDRWADLKPNIQPQVLNPPQIAAVTQSRVIKKGEKIETFLLGKIVSENTGQVKLDGQNQLEARIREQAAKTYNVNAGTQATANESEVSEFKSHRNSQLTHLNEPTLVNRFSKKANELEQLIQKQTSSDGSVERSCQQRMTLLANRTHNLSLVSGRQMGRSSKRVTIVRHSQERYGNGQVKIEGRRMNEDLLAVPIRGVAAGSIQTKRLISKSSQHGSSMTANQIELKGTGLRNNLEIPETHPKIDELSVATNTLQEDVSQAEVQPLRIEIQNQIHVGASHTFYNEAKQKIQGIERIKACSQLIVFNLPEAEANANPSPDLKLKSMETLTKEGECIPALITTETPLQMMGLGANNNRHHTKSMDPFIPANSSDRKPETPLRHKRIIIGEKGLQQYVTKTQPHSRFHETAAFADQMHRSTGLPINTDRFESELARENPVRQSYATQISFIGMPGQQHTTINVHEGSQDYQKSMYRRNARGGSGPQSNRTLIAQGEQIVHNSGNGASLPDASVFIDKRVHKGTKLFVSSEAAATAAGTHKAALSPLTSGGQQILALGTSRRNYDKTATPISKLLTPHELTELQRFMGTVRNQNKMSSQSPGNHFRIQKPAREIVLNQVSTARIMTIPSMQNASGLDLLSKIRAMDPQSGLVDSPNHNGSSPKLNHDASLQKWKPLKTSSKPMFGRAVRATEIIDSASINAPPNMLNTLEPIAPVPLLTQASPQGNKRRRKYTKSPTRRLQDQSVMKSQSRYLMSPTPAQSQSINNYRMVGLKAVLNSIDSQEKVVASRAADQMYQVVEANLNAQAMMINSNSQTDMMTIRADSEVQGTISKIQKHQLGSSLGTNPVLVTEPEENNGQNKTDSPIIGLIGVDFLAGLEQNDCAISQPEQNVAFEGADKYQRPVKEQQQSLYRSTTLCNNTTNQKNTTNSQEHHQVNPASQNKTQLQKQMFVSAEGQQIQIAEGVLPQYRALLARNQQLTETARRRYVSNDAHSRRTLYKNNPSLKQSSDGPSRNKMAHSYVGSKRTNNPSAERDHFLFNDVKNWKKSVHRNNQLISGASYNFSTLN